MVNDRGAPASAALDEAAPSRILAITACSDSPAAVFSGTTRLRPILDLSTLGWPLESQRLRMPNCSFVSLRQRLAKPDTVQEFFDVLIQFDYCPSFGRYDAPRMERSHSVQKLAGSDQHK
ncbi:hypothetical protein ebA2864 [Aromatoleum aromaticum EbN1]|uniref:Uncharacterized protein n=1 Tax=Aromatoleum aromaticum (strain DSM 19018 / LMG 30748 / EbN1) TaxID=76114 RepID=Q5P4M4_AROAE|nr:hypothetical protein ebA2864 [Aromatoleum aromaticum EbN1]